MEEKIKIECSNCKACFMLPLSVVSPQGKKVRCSKCQHTWIATLPESDHQNLISSNLENIENIPSTPDNKQRFFYSAPLTKKRSFLTYVSFTIFLLTFLSFLLISGRNTIIGWAPRTAIIYQKIGVPISAKFLGYSFEDLSYSKIMHQGIASLLIRGHIKNTSFSIKSAPLTKVGLLGKGFCPSADWKEKLFGNDFAPYEVNHCILKKWFVKLREKEILPGQSVPFETIWPLHPSRQIKNIYVDFESKVS